MGVRVVGGEKKKDGWNPDELNSYYRKFVAPTKTLESAENIRVFLVFEARPLSVPPDRLRTAGRNPRLALRGTTISFSAQSYAALSK